MGIKRFTTSMVFLTLIGLGAAVPGIASAAGCYYSPKTYSYGGHHGYSYHSKRHGGYGYRPKHYGRTYSKPYYRHGYSHHGYYKPLVSHAIHSLVGHAIYRH